MRCSRCPEKAVSAAPALCAQHFIARFESRVKETIREFRLLKKSDRVAVACSGGKDSTALLFLLKRLGYYVTALAVDEGIAGYRDKTLADLVSFTEKQKIPLRTVSFTEAYGKRLDEALRRKGLHPCTLCGTFRRQLLNKAAKGFDVLATGHNMDDEAQAVLMNLCRANLDLFTRIGPMTTSRGVEGMTAAAAALARKRSSLGSMKPRSNSGEGCDERRGSGGKGRGGCGFVRRVKPLYFLSEKEVLLYALLNGLATEWNECPYAPRAYRNDAREALLAYEAQHPGARERILRHFLKVKRGVPPSEMRARPCAMCGEPSTTGSCRACRLKAKI